MRASKHNGDVSCRMRPRSSCPFRAREHGRVMPACCVYLPATGVCQRSAPSLARSAPSDSTGCKLEVVVLHVAKLVGGCDELWGELTGFVRSPSHLLHAMLVAGKARLGAAALLAATDSTGSMQSSRHQPAAVRDVSALWPFWPPDMST